MREQAKKQELKRRAHKLRPVVLVGKAGVTEPLLKEVDRALQAHELIKVRLTGDRERRREMAEEIAARLGAELVQLIGRVAVLYREREEEPSRG